eukprot:503721-Rhodomonas_salina.2
MAIEVITVDQRSKDETVITITASVPASMAQTYKKALLSPSWPAFLESRGSPTARVETVEILCASGTIDVKRGGCEDCPANTYASTTWG